MNPVKEVDCLPVAMGVFDPDEVVWTAGKVRNDVCPTNAQLDNLLRAVDAGCLIGWATEAAANSWATESEQVTIRSALLFARSVGANGIAVFDESIREVARYPVSLLGEL